MMAIKARANVTISRIVDISTVTRYYKLQSSTTIVPSKPTTNPPSGWTTTEPSYSSGSTNTLYFVDCTVMTNGTFSYSEVSKSSSYEAAKDAYNKAANCEVEIEQNRSAIEIRATISALDALSDTVESNSENYVSKDDYSKLDQDLNEKIDGVAGELGNLDSTVASNKNETDKGISTANDSISSLAETISKYFKFSGQGMEIGSSDSSVKLVLNNREINFAQNENVKSSWTPDDFKVGNIKVEVNKRAQFGNFAFVPRSDGSLMFLKVDDEGGASS